MTRTIVSAFDRLRDLVLLLLVVSGVVFFGGVHLAFVASSSLVALALVALELTRVALRGSITLSITPLLVGIMPFFIVGAAQWGLRLPLSPEETSDALLRYGAAAIVFTLAAQGARDRASVRRLGVSIVILGVCEALYGVAEHFGRSEFILLWPKTYPGAVSGTYVNRNHFAGMLAMITPLAIGLALSERWPALPSGPSLRTRLVLALDAPAVIRRVLWFLCAFVCGVALCLSLSRGGVLALTAGLGTMSALFMRYRDQRSCSTRVLAPIVVAGLTAVGSTVYGLGPLVERFRAIEGDVQVDETSRPAMARRTLSLIAKHPLLGVGLGNFERAYELQRSKVASPAEPTTWRIEHAHCDILELTAEVGIPIALLLATGFASLITRGVRRAGIEMDTPLALGLVASLASALVHACVDFGFELLGTLSLGAFLAGLLAGATSERVLLHGLALRIGAALAVVALTLVVPFPLRVLRAELLVHPTVRSMDDQRDPESRLEALEAAIRLRPEKAELRLDAVRWRDEAHREAIEKQAREAAARLVETVDACGGTARPTEELVQMLTSSIRTARAHEEQELNQKSLLDLRAALQSEPSNVRARVELHRMLNEGTAK